MMIAGSSRLARLRVSATLVLEKVTEGIAASNASALSLRRVVRVGILAAMSLQAEGVAAGKGPRFAPTESRIY